MIGRDCCIAATWCALLASCGDGPFIADAGSPDAFRADAGSYVFAAGVSPLRCDHPSGVRVEIDGEMTLSKVLEFSSPQAAESATIVVETWFEESLLDQVVVDPDGCSTACPDDTVMRNSTDYAIVAGGRLLRTSMQCDFCVLDGHCALQECSPTRQEGCDFDMKCSRLIAHDSPLMGYVACLPNGARMIGQSCTAGPASYLAGYDDCAAGGLCSAGICRPFCDADAPCTEGSCRYGTPALPDGLGTCEP